MIDYTSKYGFIINARKITSDAKILLGSHLLLGLSFSLLGRLSRP